MIRGHEPEYWLDACRHCGMTEHAMQDMSRIPFCTSMSTRPLPLWLPLTAGAIITFIMLWGLIHG